MKRRYNWDAKPEWILNTAGVVSAFYTAVKAYTEKGEGVMIMTPVYYPFYSAISLNDRTMVETRLIRKGTRYEIDWEDFEKKAADENTKLLLCSPHNPCSRLWTREELERIGRICIDNNVFIVSDEIHFDLVMPGHEHIVFASISEDFAQNCLVCTAPSKTFNLAGLDYKELERINENEAFLFLDEGYLFGDQGECFERWNLACPTSYVQAALERMKEAYAPYLKK